MGVLDRLNLAQRVVVIVGLGAVLGFLGDYVTSLNSFTGWTGYAPLSSSLLRVPGSFQPWEQLLVWLALVAVWVAASLFVLHGLPRRGAGHGTGERRSVDASRDPDDDRSATT
jgi:hypothetical protein